VSSYHETQSGPAGSAPGAAPGPEPERVPLVAPRCDIVLSEIGIRLPLGRGGRRPREIPYADITHRIAAARG
jgi:hypothetical protein